MNSRSPIPGGLAADGTAVGSAWQAPAPARDAGEAAARPPRPWGFWATLGWTALWLFVSVGTGMILLVGIVVVTLIGGWADGPADAAIQLGANGLVLGIVAVVQMPVLMGLTFLLAWIRMPVADYLALRPLGLGETAWGLGALFALMLAQDFVTWGLDRPIVSEFMVNAYETAGFLPLLLLALLVAAPVVEELFFRGFMYKGLAASKVGPVGAILITSAVWAVIHFQYDWYGVGLIFLAGLFLGAVRWRTKSVALPMVLHAMMNAVATTQTIVVAEGWA